MSNDPRLAVMNAMSLLGKKNPKGGANNDDTPKMSSIPTARTRSALELLFRSNVDSLRENQVNIRQVTQDLFNWTDDGKNRATKTVMRSLTAALNTPDKYAQAVELASYVAAAAPLLEPDRLARLFQTVDKVKTVYAPNLYTLQLSSQLRSLFSRYSEEIREKLLADLWVSSHEGRWWDLTTGHNAEIVAVGEAAEPEEIPSKSELAKSFIEGNLAWTPGVAEAFSKLPYDEEFIYTIRNYNNDYSRGITVDPDIGLLSAYLPWIPLQDRTESPVSILLRELKKNLDNIEGFELPEKPRSFKGMFPNIRLIVGNGFPFPAPILATNGIDLVRGVKMELITNPAALAANRDYMGNCTWSYKSRMEDCEYALYKVIDERNDQVYNAAMTIRGQQGREEWGLQEINGRHNRGGVPQDVRQAFSRFAKEVPVPDPNYRQMIKETKQEGNSRKLRYRLYADA